MELSRKYKTSMNLGWMFPSPGFRLQSPRSSVFTTSDAKHFQPPVSFLWFLSVVAMKPGGCCCWVPKALERDKDELQEVTLSPSGSKETSCEVSLKKIKQEKRSAEAHFLDSDVVGFRCRLNGKWYAKTEKNSMTPSMKKKQTLLLLSLLWFIENATQR